MVNSGKLSALVWGPIPATVAAVILAVQGLVDDKYRANWLIIGVAGFLIVHSVISYVRDRALIYRASERYNRIMRKLLDLLAALGTVSAGNHQLWKIALYMPRRKGTKPWIQEMVRVVPLFLTSRAPLPDDSASVTSGPIGVAYEQRRSVMWSSESPGCLLDSDGQILDSDLDPQTQAFLTRSFGGLRAFPVTDQTDSDCMGIVVVYTEPQDAVATLGTLSQDAIAQSIRQTALAIHDVLKH
jgi:hypothetical protein